MIRTTSALGVPLFMAYVLLVRLDDAAPPWKAWLAALASAVPAGLALLAFFAWNYYRYGDPLFSGYIDDTMTFNRNLFNGLYMYLFSTGRGYFFYTPVALLSLACVPAFARKYPRETILALGIPLAFLVMYSLWGGNCAWKISTRTA